MTDPDGLGMAFFSTLFVLALLVLLVVPPAYQARRRGYNPVVWGIASILALNPIFLLVVLAMAPHRARLRLREEYTRELDTKLAGRTVGTLPSPAVGDSRRIDTSAVGDRPTYLPPDRSIGDEQTRV